MPNGISAPPLARCHSDLGFCQTTAGRQIGDHTVGAGVGLICEEIDLNSVAGREHYGIGRQLAEISDHGRQSIALDRQSLANGHIGCGVIQADLQELHSVSSGAGTLH
jgi:hypothetical protein